MSTEENKAIVLRFLHGLPAIGDVEVYREVLAEDFYVHPFSRPAGRAPGLDEYIRHVRDRWTAFSDAELTIDSIAAENDRVFVRYTLTSTHTGSFGGPGFIWPGSPWSHIPLPIEPTGKRFTHSRTDGYRIANGKIVEFWEQWDILGFLQQLGYTPRPEPAA